MYEPVGYEAYGEYEVFPNSQEALLPVEGTIARGYSLYDYDNTNEGYEAALKTLKSLRSPRLRSHPQMSPQTKTLPA